jgi:single-strand DNA-binding protein
MASVNKLMVIGNVGSEPEMRFTPNGNPVTSFRVATNWRYTTSQGERKEETEWFTVVAWNRLAEQCNQFLTKGRLVYVEGRLRSRTWEGQDGEKRFRNEIVADKVTFLDKQAAAAVPEDGEAGTESGELSPEDIPFS